MQADFHMHTNFSTDADKNSTPEKMIRAAVQKGLQTICITDHHDIDYPNRGVEKEFILDLNEYFQELRILQKKYKEQIDVRIGIEIGLQPHLGKVYNELIQTYPFDFVIGSVHVFDGMDPYYKEYFKEKTLEDCYRRAFEVTLEDVKNNSEFDVLGHLDYIVRYGCEKGTSYSYNKFADVIDEILKRLIESGKGIEFNTAGFKYELGFGHPHTDVLKRYKELGGEIITIGSDAHRPEHIAYDFHKVSEILRYCGFKNYTEYVERKPIFRQLP